MGLITFLGLGILFYLKLYEAAFWLGTVGLANSVIGLMNALINPSWYQKQRREAGLETDLFNPRAGLGNMVVIKLLTILPIGYAVFYIGGLIGYF